MFQSNKYTTLKNNTKGKPEEVFEQGQTDNDDEFEDKCKGDEKSDVAVVVAVGSMMQFMRVMVVQRTSRPSAVCRSRRRRIRRGRRRLHVAGGGHRIPQLRRRLSLLRRTGRVMTVSSRVMIVVERVV